MGGSTSVLDLSLCNISNWHVLCSHYGTQYAQDQPRFERQYTWKEPQNIDHNMKCSVCGLLAVQELTLVKKPKATAELVQSNLFTGQGWAIVCKTKKMDYSRLHVNIALYYDNKQLLTVIDDTAKADSELPLRIVLTQTGVVDNMTPKEAREFLVWLSQRVQWGAGMQFVAANYGEA